MNIQPAWTNERVSQLRTLAILAKYSARQISDAMGVTRNTVIGKLRRLGISLARPPTSPRLAAAKLAAKLSPESRPERTERNGFRKPPAQRMVVGRGKNNTYVDAVKMVDLPEITDLPPDTSPNACTIAGLTDWMCRWPLSEPAHDMLYCGAASFGPWCQRHRRLVFKPLGARKTG